MGGGDRVGRSMVRIVGMPLRSFVGALALVVLCAVVFAVPATAARSATVSTKLSGKENVPPVHTKGRGAAEFKLKPSDGMICYELRARDLSSPPVAAHIHKGPPGMDGPIVVHLRPPAGGKSSDCVPAERNLIRSISRHPHAYYALVHTAEFPDGEIRGQLERGPLPAR
jgi:hypothetical protein